MMITLEYVRDERGACYTPERLAELYDRPHTPTEVLTRTDGKWADVPGRDRLWTVLYKNVLPDRIFRLFAADEAERACMSVGWTNPDSLAAIQAARDFASGKVGQGELAAAYSAACEATCSATRTATRSAAFSAAFSAACSAADAAACSAACSAADAAARSDQCRRLAELIEKETDDDRA